MEKQSKKRIGIAARIPLALAGLFTAYSYVPAFQEVVDDGLSLADRAWDRLNADKKSGSIEDIAYSTDQDILSHPDSASQPLPSHSDWPMIGLETSVNTPPEFIEDVARMTAAIDDNHLYQRALLQGNFWASMNRLPTLSDVQLDLTSPEIFDFMNTVAYGESEFGQRLLPVSASEDDTGHYRVAGIYHKRSFTFMALLGAHGPYSIREDITIERDSQNIITTAEAANPERRAYFLNLRFGTTMAPMMMNASIHEATSNYRAAFSDYPEFRVRETSLLTYQILGQQDAFTIAASTLDEATLDTIPENIAENIRENLQDGCRIENSESLADVSADCVIPAEHIARNSSLFYDDNDQILTLKGVFESIGNRYAQWNTEFDQYRATISREAVSNSEIREQRAILNSHPAFLQNLLNTDNGAFRISEP